MSHDIDQYWSGIKEGNVKAFEQLFKETYSSLCYYARKIVQDSQLAEEIVQDTFCKIWQRRDIIVISTSFKAYLFQSIRNLAIDTIKKRGSKKLSFSNTVSEENWQFILQTFQSDDHLVEKIISDETEYFIQIAINSLTPQCRIVFLKIYENSMSVNDVAKQLKISAATVRVHIHNALIKIKELLQEKE